VNGREAAIHPARETEREVQAMIKVSIEVHSGAARFRVAVQAQSVQQALGLTGGRFPDRSCRVKPVGSFSTGTLQRAAA